MRDQIAHYIKNNKKILAYINNHTTIIASIKYMANIKMIVHRGSWKLLIQYLCHTFCYYVARIKYDVIIKIDGYSLTMPNHMKPIDGVIEVMVDEFYQNIQGYKRVLDLGGYLGESAMKFATNNQHVDVFEAHPGNFTYLEKNCRPYANITSYNNAVVGGTQTTMEFYGGAFNMGASTKKAENMTQESTQVKCVNIIDVLRHGKYDALKMDIEGGEFECMEVIIQDGEEYFASIKVGSIECHVLGNQEHSKQTQKILEWLLGKSYFIGIVDAVNGDILSIDNYTGREIVLIHFKK